MTSFIFRRRRHQTRDAEKRAATGPVAADPLLFFLSPFQLWAGRLVSRVNDAGVLDNEWLPAFSRGSTVLRGTFAKLSRDFHPKASFLLQRETGGMILLGGMLEFTTAATSLAAPLLLNRLLESPRDVRLAWWLTIVSLTATLTGRARDQVCRVQAVWAETSLRTTIFQKSLRLSPAARIEHTPAKIINISTVDVSFMSNYMLKIHDIWSAPIQLVAIAIFVISIMGWSGLWGFVAMLALFFAQGWASKYMRTSIRGYISLNDKRLGLLRELLINYKSVKSVAVESLYRRVISVIREDQLNALRYYLIAGFSVFTAVNQTVPGLTACAAFLAYYLTGHELTAAVVFPSLAYFNLLYQPVSQTSLSVSRQFVVWSSVVRIRTLLQAEESTVAAPALSDKTDAAIRFDDASFAYAADATEESTSGITVGTLSVPHKRLTTVIGQTGSGKSSFLQAILGEMAPTSGAHQIHGSVAYAAQDPWLISGTLRDNIVFTAEYDHQRYQEVVRLCCLDSDFRAVPGGVDRAIIGEGGGNLSGGQRARVSLARAIYSDADILLLDDPFSAVDSQVRRHLFQTLRNLDKAVVLATLHTSYAAQGDHVIVFDDNRMVSSGPTSEFMADATLVSKYLIQHEGGDEQPSSHVSEPSFASMNDGDDSSVDIALTDDEDDKEGEEDSLLTELVEEEERARGAVKWSVMHFYSRASGGITQLISVAAMTAFLIAAKAMAQYWFVWWIDDSLEIPQTQYVGGYLALNVAQSLMTAALGIVLVFGSLRASRRIHSRIVDNVLSAPLWYFQQQPVGRVLNRLSADVESIDEKIMNAVDGIIAAGTTLTASLVLVAASGAFMIVAIIPFIVIVGWYLQRFRVCARELQRSVSILQSPVIAALTEALGAPASIKAYGAVMFLVGRHGKLLDRVMSAKITRNSLDTWVTLRAECAAVLVLLIVALLTVYGVVPEVQAGLALSVATTLSKNIYVLAWCATDFEIQMNSAERLERYHDYMPREGPPEHQRNKVPGNWPAKNSIELKKAFVQYNSRPTPALDGVSLSISSGERVGIVGRTGSGKSTLVSSLARLVDLTSGTITIDGVDISKIGTQKLRSVVHTLPQEPLIFQGTLRANLDPDSRHTDNELLEALALCQLKSVFAGARGSDCLSRGLSSGGSELSGGQRQLLCAARALLARPPILLVDEAAANIDFASDHLLQLALQSMPPTTTMVIISHRTTSLSWVDRVIVMDSGRIVANTSPAEAGSRLVE